MEVGTVTPMPQKETPKPSFKIPEFEAIIQVSFNNAGVEVFEQS